MPRLSRDFIMRTSFPIMIIFAVSILTACSDSQPSPTTELIEVTPSAHEPAATQTKISTPASASATEPAVSETSRILWSSPSTDLFNQVVAVDPQKPERLAYCASNEIRVTNNSGLTWETIPTSGVKTLSKEIGYPLFGGDTPTKSTCHSVTLDPDHPSSFFAVFTTAQEGLGAPPVYYMGFFTTDNGDTWQAVPVPESAAIEDFGGFWNLGEGAVEVLFNSYEQAENPILFDTKDGGKTWELTTLSCPASGPCMRWGPAPANIPGMGSPLPQWILSSTDGGSSWAAIEPPVELRAPAPNQLIAFSDSEIAIVAGSISLAEPSPVTSAVRISPDTGTHFQQVELPAILSREDNSTYFPGLQMLPDESFLSQDPESNTWFWFNPQLPIWCPVNTDVLPLTPQLLQSSGERLWWINEEEDKVASIALSKIGCAES